MHLIDKSVFLQPGCINTSSMTFTQKSDLWGALASGLCLVHCLVTPLIFVAKACSVSCCKSGSTPAWWGAIDYAFIIISFFAIFWSVKTTSKSWMKYALWASWAALCFVLVNEKMSWIPLSEQMIYIPSIGLILLHIYNLKYCRCKEDSCCAE